MAVLLIIARKDGQSCSSSPSWFSSLHPRSGLYLLSSHDIFSVAKMVNWLLTLAYV